MSPLCGRRRGRRSSFPCDESSSSSSERPSFISLCSLENRRVSRRSLLHGLLLAGYGRLTTLARTGVGMSPLPVHRQTTAVPESLVGTDLHLPLDVLVDLAAKVTLDRVLLTDPLTEPDDLLVRQVTHARAGVDLRAHARLESLRGTNPEDIGERSLETLVSRNVDSGDTCHSVLSRAHARDRRRRSLSPGAACVVGCHK